LVRDRRRPHFNGYGNPTAKGKLKYSFGYLRCKQFNIPLVNCVLCNHGCEETLKHLFFQCEFAESCWTALHIVWDLSLPVLKMIEQQKRQFLSD
jgi:hypothetical protein